MNYSFGSIKKKIQRKTPSYGLYRKITRISHEYKQQAGQHRLWDSPDPVHHVRMQKSERERNNVRA